MDLRWAYFLAFPHCRDPKFIFRFYAELDELLPPTKRGSCFVHGFDTAAAVKDVIEALGVPHTEIGLVLTNGESVDFSCL